MSQLTGRFYFNPLEGKNAPIDIWAYTFSITHKDCEWPSKEVMNEFLNHEMDELVIRFKNRFYPKRKRKLRTLGCGT